MAKARTRKRRRAGFMTRCIAKVKAAARKGGYRVVSPGAICGALAKNKKRRTRKKATRRRRR
jgi:hypothetical protein